MLFLVLLGVGAGLVSALLLGTIAVGSLLGVLLFWLSPLPLIIVGLGWHWLVAALGALSAGAALSEALSDRVALAYTAMIGFPATMLCLLALTRRRDRTGEPQYLPTGVLMLLCVLYAVAVVVIGAMLVDPSLASLQARLVSSTEALLRMNLDLTPEQPLIYDGQDISSLPQIYALLMPSVATATMAITLLLSFWLGALVVRQSNRLPRPWPRLDQTRLPSGVLLLAAGSAALTFAGGYAGLTGSLAITALMLAFTLQGFAVAHVLTRGSSFRIPLLAVLWISVLLIGLPALLLAACGVIDQIFDLRRQRSPAGRNP